MKYIFLIILIILLNSCMHQYDYTKNNYYKKQTKERIYEYDNGLHRYKGYKIKSGNKTLYYEYDNGLHRYKGYSK